MMVGIPTVLADDMTTKGHGPHGNTMLETAHMMRRSQTDRRSVSAGQRMTDRRMVECGRRCNQCTECQLARFMLGKNTIRMSCGSRCQPCKPQKPEKNPSLKGFHHVTILSTLSSCSTEYRDVTCTQEMMGSLTTPRQRKQCAEKPSRHLSDRFPPLFRQDQPACFSRPFSASRLSSSPL